MQSTGQCSAGVQTRVDALADRRPDSQQPGPQIRFAAKRGFIAGHQFGNAAVVLRRLRDVGCGAEWIRDDGVFAGARLGLVLVDDEPAADGVVDAAAQDSAVFAEC